jgi:hypothetical protein
VRATKRYLATRTDTLPWLLVSERGTQLTSGAVNYLIANAGEIAGFGRVWPHMLRRRSFVPPTNEEDIMSIARAKTDQVRELNKERVGAIDIAQRLGSAAPSACGAAPAPPPLARQEKLPDRQS